MTAGRATAMMIERKRKEGRGRFCDDAGRSQLRRRMSMPPACRDACCCILLLLCRSLSAVCVGVWRGHSERAQRCCLCCCCCCCCSCPHTSNRFDVRPHRSEHIGRQTHTQVQAAAAVTATAEDASTASASATGQSQLQWHRAALCALCNHHYLRASFTRVLAHASCLLLLVVCAVLAALPLRLPSLAAPAAPPAVPSSPLLSPWRRPSPPIRSRA